MGIEEYEFLTKTMEQIETDSISLTKAKNRLEKLNEKISEMDDKSRHNWVEFNSFKETLEKEKEKLTDLENIEESSEPELPESKLRTEIKTLENSRKTKLDFLAGAIIRNFVPWSGTSKEKLGLTPIPEVVNAEGQWEKMAAQRDHNIEWTIESHHHDRKEVLESWIFAKILIPWYLFFFPIVLISAVLILAILEEQGAYLSFCYDEDGNLSSEENVYFNQVNDGDVDCTYGGDERALNASEQQQLQDIEDLVDTIWVWGVQALCFVPVLFPLLSLIFLRPKLEEVVELDLQINDIQSKLSVFDNERRRREKYESDLNSVPKREAANDAHDQSLATEIRKRDSMRVDIEDLEAKIQRLWDSIKHLIPYSSELDKN